MNGYNPYYDQEYQFPSILNQSNVMNNPQPQQYIQTTPYSTNFQSMNFTHLSNSRKGTSFLGQRDPPTIPQLLPSMLAPTNPGNYMNILPPMNMKPCITRPHIWPNYSIQNQFPNIYSNLLSFPQNQQQMAPPPPQPPIRPPRPNTTVVPPPPPIPPITSIHEIHQNKTSRCGYESRKLK